MQSLSGDLAPTWCKPNGNEAIMIAPTPQQDMVVNIFVPETFITPIVTTFAG